MQAECSAKFKATSDKGSITFTYTDFDKSIVHEKARKILSADVPYYENMLENDYPSVVHSNLTNYTMSKEFVRPPIIPSKNALRVTSSRTKSSKHGVLESLLRLKKTNSNAIGAIGFDPFFIHYSTSLQRAFYLSEKRVAGKITVSIDATGLSMFS